MSRQTKVLQRDEARARLLAVGARVVYAGYLAWAHGKVRRDGTPYKVHAVAAACVKDIFGHWPPWAWRDEVKPARLDGSLIEDWEAVRLKPPRGKIKLEKPAPLLDLAKPGLKVDGDGFVEGTLLTINDFNEVWK